jgi:hypothetical protein
MNELRTEYKAGAAPVLNSETDLHLSFDSANAK